MGVVADGWPGPPQAFWLHSSFFNQEAAFQASWMGRLKLLGCTSCRKAAVAVECGTYPRRGTRPLARLSPHLQRACSWIQCAKASAFCCSQYSQEEEIKPPAPPPPPPPPPSAQRLRRSVAARGAAGRAVAPGEPAAWRAACPCARPGHHVRRGGRGGGGKVIWGGGGERGSRQPRQVLHMSAHG
jgi:hypothetical protein